MAIEKDVVEQGLTDRGLESTLADNLSFDTEEQMNATLDGLKPRTFDTIEDVLKDEKLSTMVRTYGDKRQSDLQSKIDKEKTDKKKTDKDGKKKDEEIEPEWAKNIREQNDKILQKNDAETFTKKVNELGKVEGLNETHISRVRKSLSKDATEADIKTEITSYKKEMADLGIKDFGTPGGGGKRNSSSMKKLAEEWRDKQLKIKKDK